MVVLSLAAPYSRQISVLTLPNGEFFWPLIEYLLTPRISTCSSSTQHAIVRAIQILLDLVASGIADNPTKSIYRMEELLVSGTYKKDSPCPYGLYWRPRSRETAKATCRRASRFLEWLQVADPGALRQIFGDLSINSHNLQRAGPPHSLRKDAKRSTPSSSVRQTKRARAFPEKYIWRIIFQGCRVRSTKHPKRYTEAYNVRNQLAYLLLFFGGIRSSNLFHIFTSDLKRRNNGLIDVRLAHPTDSSGHLDNPTNERRGEYLETHFNLRPRQLLHRNDPYWAGWKHLLIEIGPPLNYSNVYWICPYAHRLFSRLVKLYFVELQSIGRNHPYLFLNLSNVNYGSPWTVKSLQSAFQSSLKRIGAPRGIAHGTHIHGARHFYGQKARRLHIDPRIRQIMMHHRSILSQAQYQNIEPFEVNEALQRAVELNSNTDLMQQALGEMPAFASDPIRTLLADYE